MLWLFLGPRFWRVPVLRRRTWSMHMSFHSSQPCAAMFSARSCGGVHPGGSHSSAHQCPSHGHDRHCGRIWCRCDAALLAPPKDLLLLDEAVSTIKSRDAAAGEAVVPNRADGHHIHPLSNSHAICGCMAQ